MTSQWKDISTAPKDGEWLLVIVAGEYLPGKPFVPMVARWNELAACFVDPAVEGEFRDLQRDGGERPMTSHFAQWTHWMPLPSPPEVSE